MNITTQSGVKYTYTNRTLKRVMQGKNGEYEWTYLRDCSREQALKYIADWERCKVDELEVTE